MSLTSNGLAHPSRAAGAGSEGALPGTAPVGAVAGTAVGQALPGMATAEVCVAPPTALPEPAPVLDAGALAGAGVTAGGEATTGGNWHGSPAMMMNLNHMDQLIWQLSLPAN